jgi:hypothetical protein
MPLFISQLGECVASTNRVALDRVLNAMDNSSATWDNPRARGLDAEGSWPTLRPPTSARPFVGATLPYNYWTLTLLLDASAWVAHPDPDHFLVTLEDNGWAEAPSWAQDDLNPSFRYLTLLVAHHADNHRANFGLATIDTTPPSAIQSHYRARARIVRPLP